MMTSTPLDGHTKWRDALLFQLRMKDVPGDRIGDILLEVESHLRETGESPENAFGDAKAYANERAASEVTSHAPVKTGKGAGLGLIAAASFAGSYMYTAGAIGAGRGEDTVLWLPPIATLLIGAAILAGVLMQLPVDLIRHPVTREPLFGAWKNWRWIVVGIVAVLGVLLYLLGRMLS